MAHRFGTLGIGGMAGAASVVLVLTVTLGAVGAVALRADAFSALAPADWAAVRFTVFQAALSALLSVAIAIPVARALARRRFFGRKLLVTILGAPFVLPVIVAVFGLIGVFGRSGMVNQMGATLGLPPISIYGAHGVILANVFFNLPLATRLILQGWLAIPAERFRLAASLGFRPADIARTLEWPMLRQLVPGVFLVIFLLCLTSFAIALTLGGGPRATTIELAIYQAVRFDFDLSKAALLALVQITVGGTAALLALRLTLPAETGTGFDRAVARWDIAGQRTALLFDTGFIALAALFLILPLSAIVAQGLPSLATLPRSVFAATLVSLAVALGSTVLTLLLAVSIAGFVVRQGVSWADAIGSLSIAVSPLVVGTGLFILLFPIADPSALALPVTALVNAVMSLPFALRSIVPALRSIEKGYGSLADSLGISGFSRLKLLWLPRLRRPLGFSAGLAAALSMGDLGVITLFVSPGGGTLPLAVYRLMAAYRMDAAAGAALLLLTLSLLLFWIFDRGGRIDADT